MLFVKINKIVCYIKGNKMMEEKMVCECGKEMNETMGDVTHNIFGHMIVVHNVPHYKCETCDKSTYGKLENVLVRKLREAYLNKQNEISFE